MDRRMRYSGFLTGYDVANEFNRVLTFVNLWGTKMGAKKSH
jgi:uncharacterized protein Usg